MTWRHCSTAWRNWPKFCRSLAKLSCAGQQVIASKVQVDVFVEEFFPGNGVRALPRDRFGCVDEHYSGPGAGGLANQLVNPGVGAKPEGVEIPRRFKTLAGFGEVAQC